MPERPTPTDFPEHWPDPKPRWWVRLADARWFQRNDEAEDWLDNKAVEGRLATGDDIILPRETVQHLLLASAKGCGGHDPCEFWAEASAAVVGEARDGEE